MEAPQLRTPQPPSEVGAPQLRTPTPPCPGVSRR
jgi:hypothetical protein